MGRVKRLLLWLKQVAQEEFSPRAWRKSFLRLAEIQSPPLALAGKGDGEEMLD